jgi:polyketide cyclase/dehydrase/lipid transport protein
VRVLTEGPIKVGTRIETEVSFFGRQHPIYVVTALDEPRREELRAESGPLRASVINYTVDELPDGQSRFTLRFAVQPNGPLRLLEPILPTAFRRELSRFLANLQHVMRAA